MQMKELLYIVIWLQGVINSAPGGHKIITHCPFN